MLTERGGLPLVARLTGANRHDAVRCAEMLNAVPALRQLYHRRRKRPATLHADTAYAMPRCRQALRRRHIAVRIARKGSDSSQRLGRHRWVDERTLAWLTRFRRVTVRSEHRADLHQAFLTLGCAMICFRTLQKTGS